MWADPPSLDKLRLAVRDPSSPIGMRMRAAYFLKQTYVNSLNGAPEGGDESRRTAGEKSDAGNGEDALIRKRQDVVIRTLADGLADKRHGSLMRHEYAYVMGQLKDERCCDALEAALVNDSDCVMVRHEAAEALGAIGAERSRPVLEAVVAMYPDRPELSDTCRLALNVMDWRLRGDPDEPAPVACACMLNPYSSVDPAPPHPAHADKPEDELGHILRDASLPIFDRYRAMFSLRNRGGSRAVRELGRALVEDTSSALLRHEVAYVLGQLQHPDSIHALTESLSRQDEHMMVRHESAEALGAIDGGDWLQIESTLERYSKDPCLPVAESCVVALDAADYWGHSDADIDGAESNLVSTDLDEMKDETIDKITETPSSTTTTTTTFRQQKNALKGISLATSATPRNPQVLTGHFNVAAS